MRRILAVLFAFAATVALADGLNNKALQHLGISQNGLRCASASCATPAPPPPVCGGGTGGTNSRKSLLSYTNNTTATAGLFFPLGNAGHQSNGNTPEGLAQVSFRIPGTLSLLGVMENQAGATGINVKLRKNGANGNEIVNISSDGWTEDAVNSDTVASGDLIDFQSNSTSNAPIHYAIRAVFLPTANEATWYVANNQAIIGNNGSVPNYGAPAGLGAGAQLFVASETFHKLRARVTGTLQNAQVVLSATTLTGAGTVKSRINGADGTIAIVIPPSTTGLFEDLVHTDPINAGDTFDFSISTTGSGLITVRQIGFAIVNTLSSKSDLFAVQPFNAASAPHFLPLSGLIVENGGGEANNAVHTGFPATFTNLRVMVSSNASATDSYLVFRDNGATCGESVLIPAGMTGEFEDHTHSDNVQGSDRINLEITGTDASGLQIEWTGITMKS